MPDRECFLPGIVRRSATTTDQPRDVTDRVRSGARAVARFVLIGSGVGVAAIIEATVVAAAYAYALTSALAGASADEGESN